MSDQLIPSGNAVVIGLEMTEIDNDHRPVVIDDKQPNPNHIVVKGDQ